MGHSRKQCKPSGQGSACEAVPWSTVLYRILVKKKKETGNRLTEPGLIHATSTDRAFIEVREVEGDVCKILGCNGCSKTGLAQAGKVTFVARFKEDANRKSSSSSSP